MLGLALKLTYHEVLAIHSQYQNPQDRLIHVIIAFLEQVETRPTWRVIVEALRSRAVNLPRLARRVEAIYCPSEGIYSRGIRSSFILLFVHCSHDN